VLRLLRIFFARINNSNGKNASQAQHDRPNVNQPSVV
jgi:hypothetical protein